MGPRRRSAPSSRRSSSSATSTGTPRPRRSGRPGGRPRRRRQRHGQDDDDRQARRALRRRGPDRSSSPPRTRSAPPPSTSSGSGPTAPACRSSPTPPAPIPARSCTTRSMRPSRAARDLVIADTAGRLHTKSNLMDELTKIRRIVDKRLPGRGARDAVRARCDDRPERPRPGEGVPRGRRPDRDRPDQARLDRQGRHRVRHRGRAQGPGPLRRGGGGRQRPPAFDPDAFVEALFAEPQAPSG